MRMGSIRWEESSTLDQPTLSAPHPDRPPPYNTTSIRYDRFQYYFICFLCRWRQKLTIPDLCSLTLTTGEVQHLPPRTTSRPQVVSHRGIWTLQRNMVIQISDSEKRIFSIPYLDSLKIPHCDDKARPGSRSVQCM